MRIGYDHQVFTAQHHGGISRYFAKLTEGLFNLGVEPRIFTAFHYNEYAHALPPQIEAGCHLGSFPKKLQRVLYVYNEFSIKRGKRWLA